MLVVTRKQDERIVITRGDEVIEIVVCQIVNLARVRIGVHAPDDWRITRENARVVHEDMTVDLREIER
jgi:sRNA-binding carbon storage regulator CsrA